MLRASAGAMLRNRSALLLLVRAVHAHAEAAPACAAPPPGVSAYPLIQKWPAGNQSYVLRFALPPEEGALADEYVPSAVCPPCICTRIVIAQARWAPACSAAPLRGR